MLECVFYSGYTSTVSKEKLIRNATEATTYAQLDAAIRHGEPSVLVYGSVNVDKMNHETCVKPGGADDKAPCYVSMTSTSEVYRSHEESYDCSTDPDHPKTCYRTVWDWEDDDWSSNRPKMVEINEVSLPYYLVQSAERSLRLNKIGLGSSRRSGRWEVTNRWGRRQWLVPLSRIRLSSQL